MKYTELIIQDHVILRLDILDRVVKKLGDAERIGEVLHDGGAGVNCGGSDPREDEAAIPEPIL